MREIHYGDECPFSNRAVTYAHWDILTPDIRSNQVIHRNMVMIHWIRKPLVWKILRRIAEEGLREFSANLP